MNPGKLKYRIAFWQKGAVTRDELGGKKPVEWNLVFALWASKSERSASRRELMGDHVNYVPVFFIVRKCNGKMPKVNMRIEYNTSAYDILNITEMENDYLEIEARLVKPS
jgi:head-tail adaptor